MTTLEFKTAVKVWIVKTNGKVRPEDLGDETPIIERRIITSLQVMDLILFLEALTGQAIGVEHLKVGVFRDVNAICQNFYREDSHVN